MIPSKYILVGDMHVKPDNIDECWGILVWVAGLCRNHGARPIFMGDQMDTHGNVRVEVLEFWNKAYRELFQCMSISLVGNHDMDYACKNSSMSPFADATRVIKSLECIDSRLGLWGMGYVKHSKDFEEMVNSLGIAGKRDGVRMVLCHQEFNGAQYESGFYAPHGVQPDKLPAGIKFVSGHIHLKQQVGADIIYVGTPRQMTRADQDDNKCVWLLDESGMTPIEVPHDVSPRFSRLKLVEGFGSADDLSIKNPTKTFLDIHGTPEFIKKVIKKVPEGVKVRTFPTKERAYQNQFSESAGINVAFSGYLNAYTAEKKVSEEEKAKIAARLKELCPELVNG